MHCSSLPCDLTHADASERSCGDSVSWPHQVIELGELVHDGLAEQRVYLLASAGDVPAVQLLPDTAAARQLLARKPQHFWRANAASGALHGFLLRRAGVWARWRQLCGTT